MREVHPQEIQGLAHLSQEIGFPDLLRSIAKVYDFIESQESHKHHVISKLTLLARLIEDNFVEFNESTLSLESVDK